MHCGLNCFSLVAGKLEEKKEREEGNILLFLAWYPAE